MALLFAAELVALLFEVLLDRAFFADELVAALLLAPLDLELAAYAAGMLRARATLAMTSDDFMALSSGCKNFN